MDNTSDANKPISTATQAALNAKQDAITAGTTSQYFRGDKTFQPLDKSAVGLGNVDNTSDANKPISTATQTALDAKAPVATSATGVKFLRDDMTYKSSAQSHEAVQEKFILYAEYFSDLSGTGWATASNGGTINSDSTASDNLAVIGNRAGVATFTSAAAALTGYYAIVPATDFSMPQTTAFTIKCAINLNSASASNLRVRFGLGVTATTADGTNQIALEINGRTFQGRCKNGGSASTTASTYTMASSTWYTVGMTVASGGGSVTFFILDGATGASLFSGVVTTNIPSVSARPVFAIANDSGGGVTKLATIDNLYYERFNMGRA